MPRKPQPRVPSNKPRQDLRHAVDRGLLNTASGPTNYQTRTSSLNNPDAFLPHLSRADRLLRSDALEHARGIVSKHLSSNVRNSRIGRRALDTIIGEKGCHLSRLEDLVKQWVLYIHPRDLDGAVFQDEYVGGRKVLDYGDLPTVQPTTLPAYKPFNPRGQVTTKEEDVDADGESTKVQPSEESTMYGDVEEHDKENAMAWTHSNGWQPGLKRKADEFVADLDDQVQAPENEPKRARTM